MYAQSSAAAGGSDAPTGEPTAESSDDDVVDAEIVDEPDDKAGQ